MSALSTAMPENGLYIGEVMHQRLRPFRHRFVHGVFALLLDLDRMALEHDSLRLFGVERRRLLSFRNRDHGARDGTPLRPWVECEMRAAGMSWRPEKILLLAWPRLLGYVFNPISIYYCYRTDGRLGAVVHEVKNTFGGQRAYALTVDEERPAGAPIRQTCTKELYVSPFIGMAARYRFKLSEPRERVSIVIQEETPDGTELVATLTARRRPLTDGALARALLRHPFLPHKVILAIHWQALRLWRKGAKLQPRPDPAPAGASASSLAPARLEP
jgi:DUF1365 family protein